MGILQHPQLGGAPPAATPAPGPAPTNGKAGGTPNPMLQQLIAQTDQKAQKLPPAMLQNYKSIVVAGQAILYTPQSHQQLVAPKIQAITGPQDIPVKVPAGMVKLMLGIQAQSQGKFSVPASMLAAQTLACYLMGDIEHIKQIPITPQIAAQTIGAVVKALYSAYKISPQQVQQAVDAGKAKMGQPGAQAGTQPAPTAGAPPPAQAAPQGV